MITPKDIRNIVFSGGGVRGYSYIGVVQELAEHGVDLQRLDGVGGTSIGALIATLIASGWSPDQMQDELLSVQIRQLVDFSLTTLWYQYGLDSGRVVQEYLDGLIARRRDRFQLTFAELFQRTGIKLVLVAANLNENTEVVFSYETTPRELVARACMTSMAIPGLFAPQIRDGAFLADGGLKNNFPLRYFPAENTLGVRVEWGYARSLGSLDQVLARAAYCVLTDTERIQWEKLSDEHRANTVTVKVGDLTTIDLHLTTEHKKLIMRRGRLAIRHAFARNPVQDTARRVGAMAMAVLLRQMSDSHASSLASLEAAPCTLHI